MENEVRTGKRWCRPRNIVLVITVLVVLALAFVVWTIVDVVTAGPAPLVDYGRQMEALSADSQPPGENGWFALADALDRLVAVQEEMKAEGLFEPTGGDLDFHAALNGGGSPEELAVIDIALQRFRDRGVFDRLAEAAELPNIVRRLPAPDESLPMDVWSPDLASSRMLAKARVILMSKAFLARDQDEAVAAFDQMMYLAWAYSHQAMMIDQLVGQAIGALALERLRSALQEHEPDATTLRRLLEALDRRTPLAPTSLGLEGERLLTLDAFHRVYSEDGLLMPAEADRVLNQGAFGIPAGGSFSLANLGGLAYPRWEAVKEQIDIFYDHAVEHSKLSLAERRKVLFDGHEVIDDLGWRYSTLGMVLPEVDRYVHPRDGFDCFIAGTRLMIAIELHRAECGEYPRSLEELVPDILASIPADPFSADGFVYRLSPDDEYGRLYVLYSVGWDGTDNGGVFDEEHPKMAVGEDGAGLDFAVNAPVIRGQKD